MTTYKQGAVVLVHFPNSDLVTYKKRPALIIQDESVDTGLNQRLVAMITSNLARVGETRVLVQTRRHHQYSLCRIND
jgi:mRNA interferase MazF